MIINFFYLLKSTDLLPIDQRFLSSRRCVCNKSLACFQFSDLLADWQRVGNNNFFVTEIETNNWLTSFQQVVDYVDMESDHIGFVCQQVCQTMPIARGPVRDCRPRPCTTKRNARNILYYL